MSYFAAVKYFDNIIWCFDNPSVAEIRKASVAASHFACKTHGNKGHEERQKIRKYLCKRKGVIYSEVK